MLSSYLVVVYINPNLKCPQITVTSSSQPPTSRTLGEAEGKIAESLISGHVPTIALAIMQDDHLQEAAYTYLLKSLSQECSNLCQTSDGGSLFRRITVTALANNSYIGELKSKAPILLHTLFTLVSFNDRRNTKKVGDAHFPGICAAVAVLLKERNREMCGLQSLVSVLMYCCHCEKQVCISYTSM